jgi:hypothetical protein
VITGKNPPDPTTTQKNSGRKVNRGERKKEREGKRRKNAIYSGYYVLPAHHSDQKHIYLYFSETFTF